MIAEMIAVARKTTQFFFCFSMLNLDLMAVQNKSLPYRFYSFILAINILVKP